MADTQYKRRELTQGGTDTPSGWNTRGGAPLEQHPFSQVLKSQDTLLESARRMVGTQAMGGTTDAWLVPNTDNDGQGSQTHPDPDDEREVARFRFGLAPGSMLEARAIYLPSGGVQEFGGSTWDDEGGAGEVHWDLTWDNGANNDTSTAILSMEPSQLPNYAEPQTLQGVWPAIRYKYRPTIVPGQAWFGSAEASKWSEWTTITGVLEHKGAPRVIHTCLSEVPRLYVDVNTNTGEASAHCYPGTDQHPDIRPQTDTVDGDTYQEHRYGTLRALDVARRQADRLGPIVFQWSPYSESGNPGSVATADFPPDPYTTTSTSETCLWDTSITAWSAQAPGFAVPGHYALRFKECDPEQILPGLAEAVIPVRVNVWAKITSGTGYVTVQSNDRSRIRMSITGSSYAWHTVTGFLECQAHGSDAGTINGMIFGDADGLGGTLSVRYASVTYGDFAES